MGFLDVLIQGNAWVGEPFSRPMTITAKFGEPRDNGVGYHTGIDLAPLDGLPGQEIAFRTQGFFIQWCGVYGGTRARDQNGGYGNVLLGRVNAIGYSVLLAHMQGFCPDIQKWVDSGWDPNLKPTFSPGEVLGYQGNSGYVYGTLPDGSFGIPADDDHVSGTHTHLEVRDAYGRFVDPMTVITGVTSIGRPSSIPLVF